MTKNYIMGPVAASYHSGAFLSDITYCGIKYEQFRYTLPASTIKKMDNIEVYFRALDSLETNLALPYKHRRTDIESCEFIISAFSSLRESVLAGRRIVIGSEYLCPLAWMVFNTLKVSQNTIGDFDEIFDIYDNQLVYKDPYIVKFSKNKRCRDVLNKISEQVHINSKIVLSIIICFMHDILRNAGPDCEELISLFSNEACLNYNDYNKEVLINNWQEAYYSAFDEVDCSHSHLDELAHDHTYFKESNHKRHFNNDVDHEYYYHLTNYYNHDSSWYRMVSDVSMTKLATTSDIFANGKVLKIKESNYDKENCFGRCMDGIDYIDDIGDTEC